MGSDLPKEPRGPTAGVLRRTVRFSTVSRKGAESATASAESAPQRQVSNRHQTTLTLLKLKRVAVGFGNVHAHRAEFAGLAQQSLGHREVLGLDLGSRR